MKGEKRSAQRRERTAVMFVAGSAISEQKRNGPDRRNEPMTTPIELPKVKESAATVYKSHMTAINVDARIRSAMDDAYNLAIQHVLVEMRNHVEAGFGVSRKLVERVLKLERRD